MDAASSTLADTLNALLKNGVVFDGEDKLFKQTRFTRLGPHLVSHLCPSMINIKGDEDGNDVVTVKPVVTVFPEERCPYCKGRP